MTLEITALPLVLCMAAGLATALCACPPSWAAGPWPGLSGDHPQHPAAIQIFFVYFVLAPLTGLSSFAPRSWPCPC